MTGVAGAALILHEKGRCAATTCDCAPPYHDLAYWRRDAGFRVYGRNSTERTTMNAAAQRPAALATEILGDLHIQFAAGTTYTRDEIETQFSAISENAVVQALDILIDGVNEMGLSVGMFYFPRCVG